MAALTRSDAFSSLPAARLNAYADEIERVAAGLFGSTANTARPLTIVRRTSSLAVANNTGTVITWQTAVVDSAELPMWDPGAPTLLTARTPGQYLLLGTCRWDGGTTGIKASALLRNATSDTGSVGSNAIPALAGGQPAPTPTFGVEPLVAGDLIRLDAYQDSGATRNLVIDKGGTRLAALWLGPL